MSDAWASGSDSRWRRFRLIILGRDRWTCQIQAPGCTTRATHVDHIIELSRGGAKYDPANCRAACAACNLGRKRETYDLRAEPPPKKVSNW